VLPPLRERSADIPELVQHFMQRWHQQTGRAVPRLESGALANLAAYPWPGNVRELANFCERIAILNEGGAVSAAAVSQILPDGQPASPEASLSDLLDETERRLILRALAENNNNIADAAKQLKTDRANLYRRMRRLEIDR
jgi:DNA-binding NtrC family response regulator